MASAGLSFNRFPVGDDSADLAPEIAECSIAPHVAFCVFGMALDGDRAKFIERPDAAGTAAQGAVATRRRFRRGRQRNAHGSTVAGTFQR